MKKSDVKIKDLGNNSEGSGSINSIFKKQYESERSYSNPEMSIENFSSTLIGTSALLEPLPLWFGIIERISYQQMMGGIWVPHFVVRAENNEKFWIPIFGQFTFQISAVRRCARCHRIISTSGDNYGDLIILPSSGTQNKFSNGELGNIGNNDIRKVLQIKIPPKQFFCKNCEEIINLMQNFRMGPPSGLSGFNARTIDAKNKYNDNGTDDKNNNEIDDYENDNDLKNTSNIDENNISNGRNNERINNQQFCNYVLNGREDKVKIKESKEVMKKQPIKSLGCMDCTNLEKCFKHYVIVLMISKYLKKKGVKSKEIECYLAIIEPEKIEFVAQSWGISCVIAFFPADMMSSKIFCMDHAQDFINNIIIGSFKSNVEGKEEREKREKPDFNKEFLHLIRSLLWNNNGIPLKIRIEDRSKILLSIDFENGKLYNIDNKNSNLTKRFQDQIQFFKNQSKIKKIRSNLSSDLKIIEEKIMQMMSEPISEKFGTQGSWQGFHYFPNSFQVHYASKILLNTVSNGNYQNGKANSDNLIHESIQIRDFLEKNFDNEYESLYIDGKILGFHGFNALIQDFTIQDINFKQDQAFEGDFFYGNGKKGEELKKLVIVDLQRLVGHQIGLISNY